MPARMIEDTIQDVLTGDARENAMDFVAFLRANDIPLEESESYWDVQYNGKSVCFLWVDGSKQAPGPWTIWSDQEPGTWATWGDSAYEEAVIDERMKEVAWAHVNFCASCGGDCSPGKSKTVLGKSFDGVCSSTMAFANPDVDALACAKEMVNVRMKDILKGM